MNFKIPNKIKDEYLKLIKRDNCDYDILLRYCFYIIAYENNENLLNFAYEIIIEYTIVTKDYEPITEISMILGFAPIISITQRKGYYSSKLFKKIISEFYLKDNIYKNKILSSGQKIIYRLISTEEDYSIIAPTSYGKTELMIDSALSCNGDAIIIVPLVALLNQVKNDIIHAAVESKIEVKVITHHDIKASENKKNIYVLTQERCYQLIRNNKTQNIKQLYIDEAHNILQNNRRSFKLSEIIYILKKKYNVTVKYYSPVIRDPNSVIIKGLYNDPIKTVSKIRDLKVYRYYIYNKGIKKIYIPGSGVMTEKNNFNKYNNEIDYIIKNSKNKNIVFLNSPKQIEMYALKLCENLEKNNNRGMKVIDDFIGKDYYIFDTLEKGVIYIHSQMPEIVKQYLIDIYRKEKKIKFLITNSSILEGVNTPSDNLFIVDYMIGNNTMKPIEFINLRGRINRIGEIINQNDLSKLICDVHFIADTDYKRMKIVNEIINPCYEKIYDELNNPYLEKYEGNISNNKEFIESVKKIDLIDNRLGILEEFRIEEDNDSELKKICLINDVSLNEDQESTMGERIQEYYNKNIDNTYELIKCISYVFNLEKCSDAAINRLSCNKAQKFYGMMYEWLIKGETLKEKANKIYNYYKNAESKYIYIGSRGDVSAELENDELVEKNWSSIYKNKKGEALRLKKVWIRNNKPEKELYNLAIVKIKLEEDFISFNITPYIEVLNQVNKNIINEELYNLIKYKTDDKYEINLMQEGMSIYLAKKLNDEKYKSYIRFTEEGIEINKDIMKVFLENDILKYELSLFI